MEIWTFHSKTGCYVADEIGAVQMKDEIFFRDKLEDEWEANEVYAILSECDKDFEPPFWTGRSHHDVY